MKKQILSEELHRMQQLAGLINEATNPDDIALKYSNTAPNTPPGAKAGTPPKGPKTSDVTTLKNLISNNTTLINKLQTVNNNQEVIDFFTYILTTLNPKIAGVNKMALKKLIDDRFTK
jgi:hypothetical protein